MKKIILILLTILITVTVSAKSEKIKIAASIYPIGDIVKEIVKEKGEVIVIVKPGESPHTFAPKPSDMKYIAKADILFTVGLGLEYWDKKLIKSSGNKKLLHIELSDEIKNLIKESKKHEEHKKHKHKNHEHGEYNPHVWFSPLNVILMAERVKREVILKDNKNKEYYEKNCNEFIKKLENMDKEFKKRAAEFRKKEFVCFHPAYVYFERDYGIKHILSIEEFPGKEPSSKYIKKIIETIKKEKIEVIFAEPQFSMKVINLISKETGVKIGILDPIGGVKGRESYIELMNYNFEQIERALK
jgi:zinc transport system substrate-binding protein